MSMCMYGIDSPLLNERNQELLGSIMTTLESTNYKRQMEKYGLSLSFTFLHPVRLVSSLYIIFLVIQ